MGFLEKILGEDYSKELGNLVLDQMLDAISDSNIEIMFSDNMLSEEDFYPAKDKRTLHTNIYGIDETNNFNQFAKEFFELCDEEELF